MINAHRSKFAILEAIPLVGVGSLVHNTGHWLLIMILVAIYGALNYIEGIEA